MVAINNRRSAALTYFLQRNQQSPLTTSQTHSRTESIKCILVLIGLCFFLVLVWLGRRLSSETTLPDFRVIPSWAAVSARKGIKMEYQKPNWIMRSLKMSPFFWQWLLGWPRMSSRFDSTFFVHPFGTFWEDVNCKYVCFVVVDFFQALFSAFLLWHHRLLFLLLLSVLELLRKYDNGFLLLERFFYLSCFVPHLDGQSVGRSVRRSLCRPLKVSANELFGNFK